jgi:hypothetical protein
MANILTNKNSCEEQDYLAELEVARATLPRDREVKKAEKIRDWGGDHPDYCDACHGIGGYCGMCNGGYWDHEGFVLVNGSYQPS